MKSVDRAARVCETLAAAYPAARCSLDFGSAFELLVATVLSAQCTDERVNMVTPQVFARWPDAVALAAATQEDVEECIRSTGFFRSKASSLIGFSRRICDVYDGEVPGLLEDLVTLPGVGRKTANVVLGNCFGVPGITVDTHVGRLSRRIGLVPENMSDAVKVEFALMELLQQQEWTVFCHRMIAHGRSVCTARKANCNECCLRRWCASSVSV